MSNFDVSPAHASALKSRRAITFLLLALAVGIGGFGFVLATARAQPLQEPAPEISPSPTSEPRLQTDVVWPEIDPPMSLQQICPGWTAGPVPLRAYFTSPQNQSGAQPWVPAPPVAAGGSMVAVVHKSDQDVYSNELCDTSSQNDPLTPTWNAGGGTIVQSPTDPFTITWHAKDAQGLPLPVGDYTITCSVDDIPDNQRIPAIVGSRDDAAAVATLVVRVCKLDISVNNDDDLTDAVDGITNYLPGYEGDTPKVSTGTSFNSPGYVGQQMKVVLDGVGTGIGIDTVEFQISEPTTYPGFYENATDASLTGTTPVNGVATDRNADYSFAQGYNSFTAAGTMGASSTTTTIWCKDYGGKCKVTAVVKRNGVGINSFTITVPLDQDSGTNILPDKIADKWELAKITEWNTQFGTSETASLLFFSETSDKELKDPDGTANLLSFTDGPGTAPFHMGDHKSIGDRRDVFKEYRGYILDGGGHDWGGGNAHGGGHKRLSPVFKEVLCEVDAMVKADATTHPPTVGVDNMPNAAGIKTWIESVSTGFSKSSDGAGLRFFYILQDLATSYNDFEADQTQTTEQKLTAYLNGFVA